MTTNGRAVKLLLLLPLAAAAVAVSRPACAGNLEMVEKNVEELESLNKEALGQIPQLPRDGRIDLKAYVTAEGGKSRVRIDEAGTRVEGATGAGKARAGVEVSAPAVEDKIEFLEKNSTPATKVPPGGRNGR
jgi:hypothetical protein